MKANKKSLICLLLKHFSQNIIYTFIHKGAHNFISSIFNIIYIPCVKEDKKNKRKKKDRREYGQNKK